VVTVARRDDFIKRMADSGAEVVASSPAQFADFFQREIALYKRVAAASNIRLES
jgi:tripartite-type tricarboxylate transporter receptor subunit TctC